MKRDELLDTMRRLAQNSQVPEDSGDGDYQGCPWCGQAVPNGPCHYDETEDVVHAPECKIGRTIAWLERLPAGIALVGVNCETWQAYGLEFPSDTVIDIEFQAFSPDDLTKDGKR